MGDRQVWPRTHTDLKCGYNKQKNLKVPETDINKNNSAVSAKI